MEDTLMKTLLPLLAALCLTALTACDEDTVKCQTNADCFTGEVCSAKECVTPGPDMAVSDMTSADMAPDMTSPDMVVSDMMEPMIQQVAIRPAMPSYPGAPLSCEVTLTGSTASPLMEWLVNDMLMGMGQDFTNYGPMDKVSCRVTVAGAQPVISDAITAPAAPRISVGDRHVCAIFADGTRCWGGGVDGQLGDGKNSERSAPTLVTGLSAPPSAISAGGAHTCAIVAGAALCWGLNDQGQLGDKSTATRYAPVKVTGLDSGVTAIAAGYKHTCAIHDGAAKCWGRGGSGQLGNSAEEDSAEPVAVMGLGSGVSAITANSAHSCAIHDGAAKCWGSNFRGPLGDGGETDVLDGSPTPVQVRGLESGVSALKAGDSHTCALKAGALWCWGWGLRGQQGNGSMQDVIIPTIIPGMEARVTAFAVGSHHTCAVQDDALWCWGLNDQGQVGDGTTIDAFHPIKLTALPGALLQIDAHGETTCAVVDGPIRCWGDNRRGQLGDGSALTHSGVPTSVVLP
jgi:alpha-tubulin suppressor-like RCC1 family protein